MVLKPEPAGPQELQAAQDYEIAASEESLYG